jgi:hypothetical protein
MTTTTTYLSAPTSPMSPSRKSVSVISSRPNSDGGSTERYEGGSMYDEPLDAGEWRPGGGSQRVTSRVRHSGTGADAFLGVVEIHATWVSNIEEMQHKASVVQANYLGRA